MDPDTGIIEARLFHLDRIMFGTSAIFVFKYPLLKRKMNLIKASIREQYQNSLLEEEVDEKAREQIIKSDLIDFSNCQN